MPDLDRIHIVIENLPGARAQVSVNIPTPRPGMRIGTPAHSLALDALGWLGKQPAVAGFVYSPDPTAQSDDQQILLTASGLLQRIGYHAAAAAVLRAMDAAPPAARVAALDLESVGMPANPYSAAGEPGEHVAWAQGAGAVFAAVEATLAAATAQAAQWDTARQAVRDYHYALDTRQHGGSAAWKALGTIQEALGMRWVQGAEVSRRAIDAPDTALAATEATA